MVVHVDGCPVDGCPLTQFSGGFSYFHIVVHCGDSGDDDNDEGPLDLFCGETFPPPQ